MLARTLCGKKHSFPIHVLACAHSPATLLGQLPFIFRGLTAHIMDHLLEKIIVPAFEEVERTNV